MDIIIRENGECTLRIIHKEQENVYVLQGTGLGGIDLTYKRKEDAIRKYGMLTRAGQDKIVG